MTFLSDDEPTDAELFELEALLEEEDPEHERLQLLVISNRDWVISTIYRLHHLRFAEVGAWSPLLPGPKPGQVMSILTKRRKPPEQEVNQ